MALAFRPCGKHIGAQRIEAPGGDGDVELRGAGLMLGLRLADSISNAAFVSALMRHGMLAVVAAENVVRLLPPLIIGPSEIAEAGEKLERAAAELASGAA